MKQKTLDKIDIKIEDQRQWFLKRLHILLTIQQNKLKLTNNKQQGTA